MSNTIRELRTQFTATAKGFTTTLKNVRKELSRIGPDTEKAVDEAQKSYEDLQKSSKKLQKTIEETGNPAAFEKLSKSIKDSEDQFRQTGKVSQKTMHDLQEALLDSRKDFKKLSNDGTDSLKDIEKTIDGVSDSLKDVNKDLVGTNESVTDVGDKKNKDGISSIGDAFNSVNGKVLLVTGALAGVALGIGAFIKQGDELNQAMNNLQVETGATDEEMKGLESSLINIYRNNYGESFEDIASSMAVVKQATGLTGEALESLTTKAILLKDSFGYEVNESVRVADTMMRNFGITGDEAFTLIAQGRQKGLDKHGDMLDSFNEYSVYFKQLGFDAEGMWDIFKAGADGGAFNIDKVGDAIKEFGIRVKDGSKASGEAFELLGLDASKMEKRFAKGGETAQLALQEVFRKLGEMEDPLERNTAGVGLFGTMFEDLEHEAVISLGNVNEMANMTGDTLQKMDEVKYDSFGEAISGIGRMLQANLLIPLEQKAMPALNNFINGAKDGLSALFSLFSDNDEDGSSLLSSLGLSPGQVQQISLAINSIQVWLNRIKDYAISGFTQMKEAIIEIWEWLWPYLQPFLMDFISFYKGIVKQILDFWNNNGQQFVDAVVNAFNTIWAIVKFTMPAVMAIIETVWGAIKNIIQGAVNVIMGLVKVFIGIFTGDFKKMWEGLKQTFLGAIQLIWGWINLTFFGRIFQGAKAFILGFKNVFIALWKALVSLFKGNIKAIVSNLKNAWTTASTTTKNLFNGIWNFLKTTWANIKSIVSGSVKFVKNTISTGFNAVKNTATSIFRTIYDTIKGRFNDIVNRAKELPKKIGDGIGKMAGKVKSGLTSVINTMAKTLGKGVNGIIGGVNWVLGKVGIGGIPQWNVPQYAKGTDDHPGGPAIVGEKGRELAYVPGVGYVMLGQEGAEFLNLPEGTSVMPNKMTEKVLDGIYPAYSSGIGFLRDAWVNSRGMAGRALKGASKVKENVSGFAKKAMEILSNPLGSFKDALSRYGAKAPVFPGMLKSFGESIFRRVNNGFLSHFKDKLKDIAGYADGGIVNTPELAWIAEGGWAESIISHDPSKRTSQEAIWRQTGDALGFGEKDVSVVDILMRIYDVLESGFDGIPKELTLLMKDREIGKLLEPIISEIQNRKGRGR
ncbi:phage tail tape measure protein [Bacillus suaedae]|uniref:Phage tail tape measure protein n=1 Tax=Halalkalibacter suaedae TaxID=2822140 RepID=A0A940WU93_9BACI|nr:phage tail tape measure protein [Bacillus suaedae]MBP3950343.1 phage tail tape measure protein [Bacillus suaedae]